MGEAEVRSAERVARNDDAFRRANERIGEAADAYGIEPVPFVCECADPACTALVRLSLDEYRAVREHPRRFLVAPGHEEAAPEWTEVLVRRDGYEVVEKVGSAGELAERLAVEEE